MKLWLFFWLVLTHFVFFINGQAYAEDKSLVVGEVKAVEIPFEIRSILNGSDEVVNLNVDGLRTIIMTGISSGRTNLIVLGQENERIDYSLHVVSDQRGLVYLHEGAAATVKFNCEARCLRENSEGQGSSSIESALPLSGGDAAAK
jgi:hypothetical protein